MAADHFPSPPTFYANDVIALNGSPDRNRRGSLDDGLGCRLAEVGERLMDRRNHGAELLGHNLIASDIRGHDFRREFSIGRCWQRLVRHSGSPYRTDKISCQANSSGN
jgi:ParB-like chromosome segregation protein Spo0J